MRARPNPTRIPSSAGVEIPKRIPRRLVGTRLTHDPQRRALPHRCGVVPS
ncbi:MAG: hypothetical protein J0I07_33255 [Myxococcales bacterium]|nr:hypothetical protein [Myxococcales bacterium]